MADTLVLTHHGTGYSVNPLNTNLHFHLGTATHLQGNTTFAEVQNRFRTAGTFHNLFVVVITNTRTTACTVTTQVGGVAASQTVTLTALTTGEFEDTTNTDTVSAGEDWAYLLTRTTAAGGTECVITDMSVVYTTTGNTSITRPTVNFQGGDAQTSALTRYWSIMGYGGTSTVGTGTESEATFYVPCPGTFRNGSIRISANTLNGSMTATFRNNAGATAITFTVATLTTGTFEDTTNSEAVSAGDLVAWEYVTAGSSGSLTKRTSSIEFVSDDLAWFTGGYGSGSGNSLTLGIGNTRYVSVAGSLDIQSSEAAAQTASGLTLTATAIGIKIASSTFAAGTTFTLRKDGVDTAITGSFTANTPGWYVFNGSIPFEPDDMQSLELVHSGSGAAIVYRQVFVLYEGQAAEIRASFLCGEGGTVTSSHTFLSNMDAVTRTVHEPNTVVVGADLFKHMNAATGGVWYGFKEVSLTNAEIKALRATPKTLVAAPGTGKVLEFLGALLLLDYGGTNVFTETADNLAIRYNNGSGVIVSEAIESTGFIDQSADTLTNAIPKIDVIAAKTGSENLSLVLHNTGDGEIAGNAANDNTMRVKVTYRVWSTGW